MYSQNNPLRTKKQDRNLIYDRHGHRVASVQGGICFRTLHTRHILHDPKHGDSIAFDLEAFSMILNSGAASLIVTNSDTGERLIAQMADYSNHGFKFDYGFGRQVGLSLTYFRLLEIMPARERVEQMAMAI